MRGPWLGLAFVFACTSAMAEDAAPGPERTTCAGFDWSLSRERALFEAPSLPIIESGGMLPSDPPSVVLRLKPTAEAGLPVPPTRKPKPDTYAGALNVAAPTTPGTYQITLSGEGWIDVIQGGDGTRKPVAHTGKRDCPDLRKSLRFQLGAKPFVVEISNANAQTVKIAVTPAD